MPHPPPVLPPPCLPPSALSPTTAIRVRVRVRDTVRRGILPLLRPATRPAGFLPLLCIHPALSPVVSVVVTLEMIHAATEIGWPKSSAARSLRLKAILATAALTTLVMSAADPLLVWVCPCSPCMWRVVVRRPVVFVGEWTAILIVALAHAAHRIRDTFAASQEFSLLS